MNIVSLNLYGNNIQLLKRMILVDGIKLVKVKVVVNV